MPKFSFLLLAEQVVQDVTEVENHGDQHPVIRRFDCGNQAGYFAADLLRQIEVGRNKSQQDADGDSDDICPEIRALERAFGRRGSVRHEFIY